MLTLCRHASHDKGILSAFILSMHPTKSEIRDGMRIDWDAPIKMDDGVILRADVFRPLAEGKYPVILSYGPYAKGLAFQEGYKSAWARMTRTMPETAQGSSNKYQNWELVDPEKWVPDGYAIVRVDSRGAGRSPGYLEVWSPREAKDIYECVEWAGTRPWSQRQGRRQRHLLLCHEPVARGALQPPHLAALCIWEGSSDYYRELARHGGILCDFLGNWSRRQVASVQYGVGERGPEERGHGRAGRRRGDIAGGGAGQAARRRRRRRAAPPADRLLLPRPPARLRPHRCSDPLGGELGRPGAAPARQFRGLSAAGSKQKWLEVHGDTHFSHFYSTTASLAAPLLRPFPQGREHRLGQAAAGRAQHPPTGREIHAAGGERMAARAHAVDQVLSAADRPKLEQRATARRGDADLCDGR